MKKFVTIFVAALFALTTVSYAQNAKDIRKESEQIKKLSQSELNAKASKAARTEAKRLTKEGWMVAPGALPLEKQLDESYLMQKERDENRLKRYLFGDAMSIGENYDAAKMQAMELAKLNLAGQIQTEVTSLIDTKVANKQLAEEQAASVVQSVMAAKNLIVQSLGRVIPVVETYRIKNNKNKEVRVFIAYRTDMIKETVKKAIRKDLEERGDELHQKLDELLGW